MLRIFAAVIVMGLATLLTRAFPFLLFSRREAPKWLITGARLVPGAVMTILVLTSLPLAESFQTTGPVNWMPWAGAGVTAVLHLLFKHPLISIFGGTGAYMTLLHFCG